MNPNLKICPHCGAEIRPDVLISDHDHVDGREYVFQCPVCRAFLKVTEHVEIYFTDPEIAYTGEKYAIPGSSKASACASE